MSAEGLTWAVVGVATAGVIIRPFGWPEAVWACLGAALLVALRLLAPVSALHGIAKGADVYLFLIGMMLLSELARSEGVFDWLATIATAHAAGSPTKLFALIYGVGTLVTIFLSNDATAVVLTPAVYAATKAAKVEEPLPYLLICAFIANAASFVLPISNPANLVVYRGGHMPPLLEWFRLFALPSVVSIAVTFGVLYLTQRKTLAAERLATEVEHAPLMTTGKLAAVGIVVTAFVLTAASALGLDLGMPTLLTGLATAIAVVVVRRETPLIVVRGISWGVLPLVAGLFVLVEALNETGVVGVLTDALRRLAITETTAVFASGGLTALFCNLANNLPVGLIAGSTVQGADVPRSIAAAILIAVDLGPNLSVTGSLATILWLAALRREGESVGALRFLKLGCLVMPPALVGALLVVLPFG